MLFVSDGGSPPCVVGRSLCSQRRLRRTVRLPRAAQPDCRKENSGRHSHPPCPGCCRGSPACTAHRRELCRRLVSTPPGILCPSPQGCPGAACGSPPYRAVTPQCWCVWGPVGEPGSPAGWAPRVPGRPPSRCRGQAVAPRLPSPACQRGKVVSRRVWACRRACVRDYIF